VGRQDLVGFLPVKDALRMATRPSRAGERPAPEDVVGLLYEAAVDPHRRRRSLGALAQSMNANGALYLVWDRDKGEARLCEAGGSLPVDYVSRYREKWGREDPRRLSLEKSRCGSILASDRETDARSRPMNFFYERFLLPRRIAHTVAANLTPINRCYSQIYVERGVDQLPFSVEDVQVFRGFVHHMLIAEHIAREFALRQREVLQFERILDSLNFGAIAIDSTAKVVYQNAVADEILSAKDSLSLVGGRLHAGGSLRLERRLRSVLNHAVGKSNYSGVLRLERHSGKQPYVINVTRLQAPENGGPLGLVIVTDAERGDRELPSRLKELFGLSKAEARVAARIAEGFRLPEIAAEFGVRMSTIRTQLRAVLKKLHVKRQADVVRLVLALPPVRPSEARVS